MRGLQESMDRNDVVILTAIVVGSFVVGLVWAPVIGDTTKLNAVLEATSYVATILACIVAATALTSWKKQFRFSERFSRLSNLKDAATDLHVYRGYLQVVFVDCDATLEGESVSEEFVEEISTRRAKALQVFTDYKKAWTSAVAFLNPAEEASIVGRPELYVEMFTYYSRELYAAAEIGSCTGESAEYVALKAEALEKAKFIYAETTGSLDYLLSQKI